MNLYELRNKHLEQNPGSHFFDYGTLKCFGEALSRMRVLENTTTITDVRGEKHECYVVAATRTKNWRGSCKPYTHYHYFDVETMTDVTQ